MYARLQQDTKRLMNTPGTLSVKFDWLNLYNIQVIVSANINYVQSLLSQSTLQHDPYK